MLDVFCKRLKVKDGNGSVGGARGGGDVRRLRRGDSQEDSEGESDQWRQTCRPWTCTMEVLSLLKHSMSGDDVNPITKYFTLGKQCGSAGVEMVWKIYEAVRSEDKKEASVFIFEKKIADKLHKPRRREVVAETLRKDISHLERLRHPKILSLLHGLEECHDSLAFASEPVFASLANVLGNYERLPAVISPEIKEHEFIELEIKHGIVQITEALAYLHNTEHLIHCNICPQSILLTRKGNWKLMGFGFAEKIKDGKEGCIGQAWTTKIPKMAQPDLNYMAPEVQLAKKCSPLSDMFSVGMVICAIYNQGKSLINAEHSPNLYVKQLDQMQETFGIVAHKMPIQLVEPVEKMINKDIRYRPTAQLFFIGESAVSCILNYEAALGAIGVIKEYLDDNILRKVVLPKAKSLFFRSNNVKIRINALTCIDHLLDSLDKMLILDNILPFLANITAQDPDVIMCIVGIYKHMLSDKKFGLTHNLLATKVMPSLIPHTVNPGLTMEQFTSLVEVLREMLEQVDKQRRDKMKLETVSLPVPPRGSLKMMNTDNESDDSLPHQALLIETQRSQQLHKVMTSPGTPETQRNKINSSPKANRKNQSLQCLGMSLDEKSTLDKPTDTLRRHSLVPPPSGSTNGPVASSNNPTISITTDDLSPDRPRRPSTHSLGPFSVSGLTDFLHRGSVSSERNSGVSHRRPSMAGILPITSADSRRPSTHSVGILPISMFGEGGEKPRRPSTHSLGVFPFGCFGEDKPERPRRCSTHSLGPLVVPVSFDSALCCCTYPF
uniref:Protein kinase domain-containing protein n=1 Tax=Biomphalaria glabrata TaxID=6526 RepID=A0A2C9JL58_BIOGL